MCGNVLQDGKKGIGVTVKLCCKMREGGVHYRCVIVGEVNIMSHWNMQVSPYNIKTSSHITDLGGEPFQTKN